MCTLVVGSARVAGWPLVVLANRDEVLDRPAEAPRLREWARLAVVAPADLRAGGTWMGVNEAGVFVGLTNRFGEPPDPGRRSRGELVRDALACRGAAAAAELVAGRDAAAYNAFHLVAADARSVWRVRPEAGRLVLEELGPGWHLVTERSLGAAREGRSARLRPQLAELESYPTGPDCWREVLSRHEGEGLESTCIHLTGYGTRSSGVVGIDDTGRMVYEHAEGPPCRTPFRRVELPWQRGAEAGQGSR